MDQMHGRGQKDGRGQMDASGGGGNIEYQFPPLDVLRDPEVEDAARQEAFGRAQADALTTALAGAGIRGRVTSIDHGPLSSRYAFELEAKSPRPRGESLAPQLAAALRVSDVRVLPGVASGEAVGVTRGTATGTATATATATTSATTYIIEVPCTRRRKVRLKQLLSSGCHAGMALPMFMGLDAEGEPLVLDLAEMPHLLVAGTTGSGKSMCVNAIIMSLLCTKRPDEIKLLLIDSKHVEMAQFEGVGHLAFRVVTDMNQAAAVLDWLVHKIDERLNTLRSVGVRNIAAYNQLGDAEIRRRLAPIDDAEWARIPKQMPAMVVVIDELTDLASAHNTDPDAFSLVSTIAMRGRAAGVHLVLSTQASQAAGVRSLLKSSIPCRVACKMVSATESRRLLGEPGAELLVGDGDMLVVAPGDPRVRRCQGTFVDDDEARGVVQYIRSVAPAVQPLMMMRVAAGPAHAGGGTRPTEQVNASNAHLQDELFDRAAEIIIEAGRGSVSLLQRRLAIGYGRASRLVDLMSHAGLLGRHQGSVAREVVVTMEEWKRMKAMREQPRREDSSITEPKPAPASEAESATRGDELRAKLASLPLKMNAGVAKTPIRDDEIPRTPDYSGYQFPALDLLDDPEANYSERMAAIVQEQALLLTETLELYGIKGEISEMECGPVVTVYSVELEAGTRVARLEAIAKDLARALRAPNVRIIPNLSGRTAVGIEVPNRTKEKVRLKELMSSGHAAMMALPMFMGKDSAGDPLVLDLAKMPHMLIAGTTGSGKSVCMNTIIMSFLYTKRPDELKLVLVDPKMVEMAQFADIPHLACPVVTEMGKAAAILEWAVNKMEERYEQLKEAGVRDIRSFNELGEQELKDRLGITDEGEWARVPKKLPYMVFVIDELADLMMTNKDVEQSIVRIAPKARAVGIHLILATQRPQATVVTGLIKSNMPCRVAFKVASGTDSRIVLDQKGAELLLGQGDMLVVTPSQTDARRGQGTLVDDREARGVVKFLKSVATQNFERQLLSIRASTDGDGGAGSAEDAANAHTQDPLFDKAVEIMIESGRGSVSLLQRRLALGYGRASRLVDLMGQAGLLGEHKGSVPREVVVTMEEWKRMKEMRDEAAREGTVFEFPGAGGTAGTDDDLRMYDEEGY
ncbi:MAG: DNA translocase FtsK [Phycisphaerales bacterium]